MEKSQHDLISATGGTDSKGEGASTTGHMSAVILPMTLTQDTVHQSQVGRKGEDKRMFILSCRVTQFTKSNPWHYSGIFQRFHFLWLRGEAGVFEVVGIELRARSCTEGYTSSSESIKLIFNWVNCEISAGQVLSRFDWYVFFPFYYIMVSVHRFFHCIFPLYLRDKSC